MESFRLLDIREVAAVVYDVDAEALRAKVMGIPDEATVFPAENCHRARAPRHGGNVNRAHCLPHEGTGPGRVEPLCHGKDGAYFVYFLAVSYIMPYGKLCPVHVILETGENLAGPNRPGTW